MCSPSLGIAEVMMSPFSSGEALSNVLHDDRSTRRRDGLLQLLQTGLGDWIEHKEVVRLEA